jgi:hypothetical protein
VRGFFIAGAPIAIGGKLLHLPAYFSLNSSHLPSKSNITSTSNTIGRQNRKRALRSAKFASNCNYVCFYWKISAPPDLTIFGFLTLQKI